ncbi:MAG TPA: histidine--tRNA ligase [Burkholderiales bacterium]|nr:histidine--tRNA ligase [Burkholderiales bacterium]
MSEPIRALRGMNDILPDEAERWEALEELLRDWLRSYGYRNLRTPVLEPTALFRRAIGEATDIVEKEMYTFTDELNQESLTLRPEATASVARAAAEHSLLYGGAQRLYYIGPMYRHERPQKGRYRQFHQVGAEALGFPGPDIDAELLLMCARLWDDLDLKGIRLQLNCLGSAAERAAYRKSLVAYLEAREKDLDEDSKRRLRTNPLRVLDSKNPQMQSLIAGAPRLLDALGRESLAHFEGVQAVLKDAGRRYEINPRLVRGLDYYNLTVFEWVSSDLGAQGTVCAGGRYDGLLEQIGGKPAPACGFAMGIERLLALLPDSGERAAPEVYLVNQGERAERFAFRVAEALREAGFGVVQHCGSGSFKSQMKKADGSGAQIAVIVGDEEADAGEAGIKALREERAQFRVRLEELPNAIADLLFGDSDDKGKQ